MAGMAAGMLLMLGGGWFLHATYQQAREAGLFAAICNDDGLRAWQREVGWFAGDHKGRLPTAEERKELENPRPKRCNKKPGYQWNATVLRVSNDPRLPLAWCGAPHGYTRRWRNVLFSDLTLERVPEERFRNLIPSP